MQYQRTSAPLHYTECKDKTHTISYSARCGGIALLCHAACYDKTHLHSSRPLSENKLMFAVISIFWVLWTSILGLCLWKKAGANFESIVDMCIYIPSKTTLLHRCISHLVFFDKNFLWVHTGLISRCWLVW